MSKPKGDHALALIKAGVSAVPVVGGSIASLIGDYIPTATERLRQEAIDMLARRLEEMHDRLDMETVDKDEFAELFKTYYLLIVRTHHRDRVKAATELVVNILLKDGDAAKLSYTELDHFARCLDVLSIGALATLGHAAAAAREHKERRPGATPYSFEFQALAARMGDFDPDLLMGLVSELDSFNLLHASAAPAIPTKNYGNYKLQLTRLGVRFAESLLSHYEDEGLPN